MKTSSYRPDVDGLRAVAVIAVIVYHAFPQYLIGGFVGVDVFFVISGFLISGILYRHFETDGLNLADFYARRVRRIFPALATVFLACLVVGWQCMVPEDYAALGKHIAGGAGFISNFVLWNESGYFDAAADSKPLLHLWSLGVEEQFYIVWPFLVWWSWRRGGKSVLVMSAIVLLGSFGANFMFGIASATGNFYSPVTRMWELAAGAILAYYMRSRVSPAPALSRNLAALFGVALIALALLCYKKAIAFPGWYALLPVTGAVAIIWAGPASTINRVFLSNRLMVAVGLISFPLYLWHWPSLYFIRYIETSIALPVLRVWAIAAAVLLATLTYLFVERPLRFGEKLRQKTILLVCTLMLLAGAGLAVFWQDGVPSRFPKQVRDILAYRYDETGPYRESTCFLKEPGESVFGDCTTLPPLQQYPSLYLWGDSHAAHLYPGAKLVFGQRYKVTQLTAGGCPPILDYPIKDRPNCVEINNAVMQRIARERPDRVLLAAVWSNHDWRAVARTIDALHAAGIRDIEIIGSVPIWIDSLPKSLYRYYRINKPATLPTRMNYGAWDAIARVDKEMSEFIGKTVATYVSSWNILCNKQGCLTLLGNTPDSMTAWDYGHLTTKGSEFLVSHFPK